MKADFTDLSKQVALSDVLINTNSLPGSLTSKRITERMVSTMRPGSVIVDLAVDQGFGSDTEKNTTSFSKPSFMSNGVIHFAIENIPALFANTVSVAISNILTEKLLKVLKGENPLSTIQEHKILLDAILTYDGNLTNKIVADALHLQNKSISSLLK
jgi:alanine dehydrogenase